MCVRIQKNMYHAHHQIFFKSLMASQGLISNILLTNIFVIRLLSGKAHFIRENLGRGQKKQGRGPGPGPDARCILDVGEERPPESQSLPPSIQPTADTFSREQAKENL